jgi:signal transduction histidine kinase
MNLYDSSMLRDAQIEAAFAQKKFKWRFDPELEKDFDAFREIRLLRAIVPIGWSGLIIFALYSILDYVYFPPSLYPITILIRLSFICPLIAFALWCSTKTWRYKQFLTLYAGVFTLCGLGIIAIIYAAHAQGVMVPYDGLLLMLMFGFFLMELPFIWINSIAWGLTAVYVLMEIQVGFPSSQLISNLFFLITGNVLGGIGSLFQEQSLRKQFLQETLIARSRDALQKESEAKTRLLTAASHDLRQPLHAMTLITEDLQEQIQGEQEQAHLLQLKAAIDNLDQLLNSVLDISKLSVGMISAHKRAISIKSLSLQLQRSLLFDANLKKN